MNKEELIIGFFEKGYCCDLDEVKNTCLDLLKENKKQKEVINRIFNETTETRNIINNTRGDNMLTKGCLISYLGIVEDILKEVSE